MLQGGLQQGEGKLRQLVQDMMPQEGGHSQVDMQPVQHWAPQYDGMEEHGLNNIRPERDHKVVAQLPGGNTVQGVEVDAAQKVDSTQEVEDHSFLYVMKSPEQTAESVNHISSCRCY